MTRTPRRPHRMMTAIAASAVALLALLGPASSAWPDRAAAEQSRATVGTWRWPVEPHPIAQQYRAPETAYTAGHRGIDISAAPGTRVHAPSDGTVYFVGTVVDRGVLTLRHGDGLLSSYEPVSSGLEVGAMVKAGEVVAEVSTGASHCPGGCVHLGVRLHGEYVSPLLYLGGIPRSILLPTRAPP